MVAAATFSDRWYMVSDLHVGLLPQVQVHKRMIRQRTYYILTEPYSQRYFQVSEELHALLARLTPRREVGEVWDQLVETQPELAPGQEEVVQILTQLHHANLLYVRSLPDSSGIFAREQKLRKRERWGKLLTFLFIRIPLWDPNNWLNRVQPLAKLLFGLPAVLVWITLIVSALSVVIPNSAEFYKQTQGVLALENLLWLYLCLAGVKIFHELGHALACKRYGGDVHTLGIMFLVLVPLPYMDATSSWSFRERRQRILVSSAGMLVELFLASVAALIWAYTGSGLIHSLAFNVMLIASVSSLIFNGNPLLRFDAYYILSDLVDIPNLAQKSTQHWQYLAKRYLMGSDSAVSPAIDLSQKSWLLSYGFLSVWYRLLITLLIILFVLDQLFAVGVLLSLITLWMWGGRPAWKVIEYLVSPQIHKHRLRAVMVTLGIFCALVLALGWVPFPYAIMAPGVIEADEHYQVTSAVDGFLQSSPVESGQAVKRGQVLAKLENPDLAAELELTHHLMSENTLLQRRALWGSLADMAPAKQYGMMLEKRRVELLQRQQNLTIRAPVDGVWFAPALHEKQHNWSPRGELFGQLVGTQQYSFTAVVSQEQAEELFQHTYQKVILRLNGQANRPVDISTSALKLIPFQRDQLASAALGWGGGGLIATSTDDAAGKHTVEGFFEVRTQIPVDQVDEEQSRLMHGLSGKLWIHLAPEPIFSQVFRFLQQLLQKRYELTW